MKPHGRPNGACPQGGEMNLLDFHMSSSYTYVAGRNVLPPPVRMAPLHADTLGIRLEHVTLAHPGERGAIEIEVTQVQDLGTYWLVTGAVTGHAVDPPLVRARLPQSAAVPTVGEAVGFVVMGPHTCFYRGGELLPALRAPA